MISKEKFEAYEKVRKSGETNMCLVGVVVMLSGFVLDRKDCHEIMANYDKYKKEFGE